MAVHVNTDMASTRIVFSIYMVNLGGARSGLVVRASVFGTSGQGSISW